MFVYVFMGLAPFTQFRLGIAPFTTTNLNALFYGESILIVLVGCLAWLVGNSWVSRRPPSRGAVTERSVVQLRAQILFVVFFIAALYYIISIGPAVLFESREARANSVAELWSNPVSEILTLGTSMGLLVSYVSQRQAQAGLDALRATNFSRTLLIVNGLSLFIFVNPVSSSRYLFGTVVLSVLAAHGVFSTRRAFRAVTLAAVPGFVLLFPIADYFRDITMEEGVTLDVVRSMLSGDYDSFAQVMNAAEYVDDQGVAWGRQLLGAILLWIPRSLWATKPQPTGAILADYKEYSFHNLSAPIWAELFVDGSWLFLVVGMLLLGALLCRLDQHTELILTRQGMPGLIGCILPFFMVILLRGTLMGVASSLLVVLVTSFFVTKRRQLSSPERP
ncbi:oligosaccharide repeat unit polymerase [Kocuria sediminis]|uniref:Oligosaccharide repeat unit polymerase n=1 Tax=Kocuria sediminis TaxID=1038857 RepID=A0A6N8GPL2_9MICC|nr:oligosaccharide repeat unit polymerase [Kocuria sediminis]MUN65011.1 oligosaccharide repeat unit polymerase [Kocuria sediminis]